MKSFRNKNLYHIKGVIAAALPDGGIFYRARIGLDELPHAYHVDGEVTPRTSRL